MGSRFLWRFPPLLIQIRWFNLLYSSAFSKLFLSFLSALLLCQNLCLYNVPVVSRFSSLCPRYLHRRSRPLNGPSVLDDDDDDDDDDDETLNCTVSTPRAGSVREMMELV